MCISSGFAETVGPNEEMCILEAEWRGRSGSGGVLAWTKEEKEEDKDLHKIKPTFKSIQI